MLPKIAISYRRDDSAAITGRIYDRLREQFGHDSVFMDIDNVRGGENFEEALDRVLGECVLLIAVIGRKWVGRRKNGYRIHAYQSLPKRIDDTVVATVEALYVQLGAETMKEMAT